jgi:hypothetical protein
MQVRVENVAPGEHMLEFNAIEEGSLSEARKFVVGRCSNDDQIPTDDDICHRGI